MKKKNDGNEKVKLHLGCFYKKIHGFVNVDVREDINPDVVDDCFKLNKFEHNTADLIYTSHMLEHCKRGECKGVLQRWFDVLKPGGTLRLAVPDLEAIFEYYICFKDMELLQNHLYGSQKHPYDFHYIGFDFTMLSKKLSEVGFVNVRRYDWKDTEHFFIDDFSQAYLPEISYATRRKEGVIKGKLTSLNVEANKPL